MWADGDRLPVVRFASDTPETIGRACPRKGLVDGMGGAAYGFRECPGAAIDLALVGDPVTDKTVCTGPVTGDLRHRLWACDWLQPGSGSPRPHA